MSTTMKTLLLVSAFICSVTADGAGGHHHAARAPPSANDNSHYAVYYHEDQGAPPEQVAIAAAPLPAAPIQPAPLLDPASSYMDYVPVEDYDYPVEELGTKGGVVDKLYDVNTYLKIAFLVMLAIVMVPYVLSWFGITDLNFLALGRSLESLESMITENVSYDDVLYYGDMVYKAISTKY